MKWHRLRNDIDYTHNRSPNIWKNIDGHGCMYSSWIAIYHDLMLHFSHVRTRAHLALMTSTPNHLSRYITWTVHLCLNLFNHMLNVKLLLVILRFLLSLLDENLKCLPEEKALVLLIKVSSLTFPKEKHLFLLIKFYIYRIQSSISIHCQSHCTCKQHAPVFCDA